MPIKILEIKADSAEMRAFYELPDKVYADDPLFCKPTGESVRKSLERELYIGRQKILLALDTALPVARLVARISPELKDTQGRPIGMIGFFEALSNSEAVKKLLEESIAVLRGMGAGEIIGPIDGDTWHRYRFNAGPFDTAPFMMEPYNPPYYPALWENNGFRLLSSYYSKHIPDFSPVLEKTEKFLRRAEKSGFTFRNFRKDDFEGEMKIFYDLSRAIFADNYLYTDIPFGEFLNMYSGIRSILDPSLISFVQDKRGKYAGFVFSLPDYFKALSAMDGKAGLIANMKFILNKSGADTLNIKTLGVLSECRGSGLAMALVHKAYASGLAAGFKKANLCLIRDGNASGRIDLGAGFVCRKYFLYKFSEYPS